MNTQRESTQVDLERAIGLRVRELRDLRGWSQAELGKRLEAHGMGMEQPTVYKLEKGARPIRVNEVVALAITLGVDVEDLLDPDGGERDDEYLDALRAVQDLLRKSQKAEDVYQAAKERAEAAALQAHLADEERVAANIREAEAMTVYETLVKQQKQRKAGRRGKRS